MPASASDLTYAQRKRIGNCCEPEPCFAFRRRLQLFVLDQPEQYARGITHLLDRVPHNDAVFIKQQMIAHFGQTNYYRFFRKERLVKPHEQKYIRQLFQKRGVTEEPVFDEYVEYYDLQRKK